MSRILTEWELYMAESKSSFVLPILSSVSLTIINKVEESNFLLWYENRLFWVDDKSKII